jgi:hypothetical protein
MLKDAKKVGSGHPERKYEDKPDEECKSEVKDQETKERGGAEHPEIQYE